VRLSVTVVAVPILLAAIKPMRTCACSCVDIRSHRKDYRHAKAVFIGRVIAVHPLSDTQIETLENLPISNAIRFNVERSWKGAKTSQVVVLEYDLLGCPRFVFRVGERYLVYAFEKELISYTACTRTRPTSSETPDGERELKQLGSFWFRAWATINPF